MKRKELVVLIDGMADFPLAELDGKTPLEAAKKLCMDGLAEKSTLGMLHVTPDGCKGGSEVGNLSILGYDPRRYLTGRSPIEASAIGIEMKDDDLAVRCNLVCLSDDEPYERKTMEDYSAGEITTAEADTLLQFLQKNLGSDFATFYTGISYRHCLILHGADADMTLTPPHNISGQCISAYLPQGDHSEYLLSLMKKSYELLKNHPLNISRRERGLNPANSIWLWGQGRRMSLPSFSEKYGVSGAMITAVDLLRGIARCAGMNLCDVEGATGTLETNFEGKAAAAIRAFESGCDFVYVHLEAPDECGHHGDAAGKVKAGEWIDQKIVTPLVAYLRRTGGPFRILITPDHPTPVSTRGHSSADVPYLLYDSEKEVASGKTCYCEKTCAETGIYTDDVLTLMDTLICK